MLKVDNIVKYYGEHLALDGLSFTVKKGEIFGLLGANGAGKTTTFRIIMGLLDATSGNVTLDGKKIDYNITDKIGFVTEERSLLTKLTVQEQITYYGILKGLEEKEIEKRLDYWLKRFKIEDYKNRKIKELSKGNQQKIQFIAGIINKPQLLILDEPFTGLDPLNVKMFKEAIVELQNEGCAIIFSSHQMEHIEEFCEKLTILVKGKSIISGYLSEIKKSFRKKNIKIKGNVKKEDFKDLPGIIAIDEKSEEIEIKVESEEYIQQIFKVISKKEIIKFVVEEPTLNEIFIAKVGESYNE